MPGFELIGEEERQAVNEIFEDGGVLFAYGFDALRQRGRYRVQEFERAFAARVKASHAQAVSSGTAALKTALVAMGVRPGDEVITQAFTFVATVEAIVDAGAIPVMVNVDETLNMDPAELGRAITAKTKVILPVHMLGVAARIDAIMDIANRHGLLVLEDNCQSIGASWNGRMLGTLGHAGAYSFDFGKAITTGEGGMITTEDLEIYKLSREYHDHGHEDNPAFPRGKDTRRIHGFTYRMSELQAAVGLAQLPKLDWLLARNRENYAIIEDMLVGINGLTFREIPSECEPLCDCLVFELPTRDLAEQFFSRMAAAGLGTKLLPDALDWHFGGTWDHIFKNFGMNREALWEHTLPTYDRLSRCIAIPVMVKHSAERCSEIGRQLRAIAEEVLG